MRGALALFALCIACRDDGEPTDPNPNLTVEPIAIDAGVKTAPAKSKRRVGMGDHRRREDDDNRERRRKPPGAQRVDPEVADVEEQRASEERRRDAERRRLTEMSLESLSNSTGPAAPIQTR